MRRETGRRVAIALIALWSIACSERMGKGFDFKRMRRQARYSAYGANAFYANGSAMRTPPAGTVARESSALDAPPPPVDLARGESRFRIYCAVCHGERGDGVSIVGSNMDDPKPPSLITAAARSVTPRVVYEIVTEGGSRMPSFASELSAADRWQVVAYLASLQARAADSSRAPTSAPDTASR
jgi:mono/diheme cytochrome c family protein